MTPGSASRSPLNTAVLFLVFNRPDPTGQVFEAIRQARPTRLYVAADGAREGREDELLRTREVREIATAVDWPCELKTLFREKNLGCKTAVSEAITWFFEQEPEGIILEDDCLPHPDFFGYCAWGLDTFREHGDVWHINGNNFCIGPERFGGDDVAFGALAQVWGWASWADRWRTYQANPFYLGEQARACRRNWRLSLPARITETAHIAALKNGLDTWDYQWQIGILNAGGLAVCPVSNLISNLGDGPDATHTKFDRERIRLPTQPLQGLAYADIALNREVTRGYEDKMALRSARQVLPFALMETAKTLWRIMEKTLARLCFGNTTPVLVASTGRSASTMLADAVARAYIAHRYAGLPGFLQRALFNIAVAYIPRLSLVEQRPEPVLKTHDLYSEACGGKTRAIFVYGDPLDSALSVRDMQAKEGRQWVEEHIYHLNGRGSPGEIFEKDVLNYEQQMNAWSAAEDVLCVYYDDLWQRQDEISAFVGFAVELPQRRARADRQPPGDYNRALFERLRKLAEDVRAGH